MKKPTTLTAVVPAANVEEAWQEVGASFEELSPIFGDGLMGQAAANLA